MTSYEFSDKQMIQNLPQVSSPNTVEEVRKKLEDEKIIGEASIGTDGEKFYKIIDEVEASRRYNRAIGSVVRNT